MKLSRELVQSICHIYSDWLVRRMQRSIHHYNLNNQQNDTNEHIAIESNGETTISIETPNISKRRLHVGYASAFLKSRHPLHFVLGGMFREHNRSKVSVTCIHLGKRKLNSTLGTSTDSGCDVSHSIDPILVPMRIRDKQLMTVNDSYSLQNDNDDNDEVFDHIDTVSLLKQLMVSSQPLDVLIDIDGYTRDTLPSLLAYSQLGVKPFVTVNRQ